MGRTFRSIRQLGALVFLVLILAFSLTSADVSVPKKIASLPNSLKSKIQELLPGPLKVKSVPVRTGGGDATISSTVFNLVKAIVGVGVLSLPAGVAAFGDAPSAVIPAVTLIAVIGILSGYGFALIGKVCAYTGATSYRDAWAKSVGPRTSWIPAYSATIKTFLACLAISMVLADTFSNLLSMPRTTALLGVTLSVLLPLCLQKSLAALAPFSLLGVLGMLYTALAMAMRYLDKSYAANGKLLGSVAESLRPSFGTKGWESVFSPSSLILVCMLSTAYMCHFAAPKVYQELKDNTLPRFHKVVGLSFGTSVLMTAFITAVGYLTFGSASSGLILNNYSSNDAFMFACRVAVAASLVFSYPIIFQGCRDGLMDMLSVQNTNAMTLGLLGGVTALAIVLKDVSFVLAFGGATLGNLLTYVYPAMMYSKTVKDQNRSESVGVAVANSSAILGIVMGVIGAKMAIEKVAK